jgi:phosphatidylglycerophosphatase A|tara:strand:+ start:160 stop:519 length:360 start_codon:yes stop_codon:yes gene_type:complete
MKNSDIISYTHSSVILYLLLGWIFENQRQNLILLLPSIQFQFLINDNNCILTQLENKLIKEENKDKKEDDNEVIIDSFIGKKLKEYNIDISDKKREIMIHSITYGSFLLNYYLVFSFKD